MKKTRLVITVSMFIIVASLNSFATHVIANGACHVDGGKSAVAGQTPVQLYSCPIPPNVVPGSGAIRATVSLHSNSDNALMTAEIFFAGHLVFAGGGSTLNMEQTWTIIITNNGNSTGPMSSSWDVGGTWMSNGSFGGCVTGCFTALGPGVSQYTGALPWDTGWFLEVAVSFTSGTGQVIGDAFQVEAID